MAKKPNYQNNTTIKDFTTEQLELELGIRKAQETRNRKLYEALLVHLMGGNEYGQDYKTFEKELLRQAKNAWTVSGDRKPTTRPEYDEDLDINGE